MKKPFVLILCLSIIPALSAQTITTDNVSFSQRPARLVEKEQLDTSVLECVYLHTTYDPVLKQTEAVYEILQVGNKHSCYWDYGYYRIDSVVSTMETSRITNGALGKIYAQYHPRELDFLLRHKQAKSLQFYGNIYGAGSLYEEPVPVLQWELGNETRKVCGFLCRKATTTFRGRTWTVWYTEELSSDDGPWKLNGLPGLILKATSADKEHYFEAVVIRKRAHPIVFQKYRAFQSTREKFNKAKAAYCWNTGQYIAGSPLAPRDMDGKEKTPSRRRLFYNPLEKE